MIYFILGFVVGCVIGTLAVAVVMACCAVAGRCSRQEGE